MPPEFQVETLSKTELPQTLIYQALHQDYSPDPVIEQNTPSEDKCGLIAVKRLLNGNKGHFGCLEHPSITLNCLNFPHSVVQQARTHRIGVSFDVQSFRYTEQWADIGWQIFESVGGSPLTVNERGEPVVIIFPEQREQLEAIAYLRPVGEYQSRKGKKFNYREDIREKDLGVIANAAVNYALNIQLGMAPEQARGTITFDYRQHFVVTFNLRSLLHFLDLRAKPDAQWEIVQLAELIVKEAKLWCPEIMAWYLDRRYRKAILAP